MDHVSELNLMLNIFTRC